MHEWRQLTDLSPANNVTVSTCVRCGLLELKTTSGTFYFTQIAEPYLNCKVKWSEFRH